VRGRDGYLRFVSRILKGSGVMLCSFMVFDIVGVGYIERGWVHGDDNILSLQALYLH
jgi:hypothetical protein